MNGCVTFCEFYGPLAAYICDKLGLAGVGLKGALIARSKNKTQQTLLSMKESTSTRIPTSAYASRVHYITKAGDIDELEPQLDFPCVMKPEFGFAAVGVVMVNDAQQCHQNWDLWKTKGVEDGYETTMVLTDYIEGSEHDVDVILYRGHLVAGFFSDNGPTRIPKFIETSFTMPSLLHEEKQRQMIVAAHQCCLGIGLFSGVFNVELKMTPTGPKLLEINARMGGSYIRHNILALYDVDLLFCAFMIACDVKPFVNKVRADKHVVGMNVVPAVHRAALSDPEILRRIRMLEEKGEIVVTRSEENLPLPDDEGNNDRPLWNIAVTDEDPEMARVKLIDLSNQLGLNTEEYPVDQLLSFSRPFNITN